MTHFVKVFLSCSGCPAIFTDSTLIGRTSTTRQKKNFKQMCVRFEPQPLYLCVWVSIAICHFVYEKIIILHDKIINLERVNFEGRGVKEELKKDEDKKGNMKVDMMMRYFSFLNVVGTWRFLVVYIKTTKSKMACIWSFISFVSFSLFSSFS